MNNFKFNSSWNKFIKENNNLILDKLDFINKTKNLCPKKENVFRFFMCDLNKTKCIILGMDPYPSTYLNNGYNMPVATGRAFEVENVKYWIDKYKQSSLSKIFKALWYYKYNQILSIDAIRKNVNSKNIDNFNVKKWFDDMESKGVIFLNATLTTVEGKSGAHSDIWDDFMDKLMVYINNKNNKIKWLIWGNHALDRVSKIIDNNSIIYSCHPASRVNNNFIEDNCFKKMSEIEWF